MTAPILTSGTVVGETYTVTQQLGFGGSSATYRAQSSTTEVIVRVFSPTLRQHPETITQLESILSQANELGGSVVQTLDAGYDAKLGAPFCVSEVASLSSFHERMQNQPLKTSEVAAILKNVAATLDMAHSRGLFHHGLKPTNVFIDNKNTIQLSDFGAQLIRNVVPTLEGSQLSLPWLSPEQLHGAADARADQFSLALIAFYALTTKSYWRSSLGDLDGLKHEIAGVRASVTARALELGTSLDASIDSILTRALSADPAARFGSCGEFAHAFEGISRTRAFSSTVLMQPPAPPPAPASSKTAASAPQAPPRWNATMLMFPGDTSDEPTNATTATLEQRMAALSAASAPPPQLSEKMASANKTMLFAPAPQPPAPPAPPAANKTMLFGLGAPIAAAPPPPPPPPPSNTSVSLPPLEAQPPLPPPPPPPPPVASPERAVFSSAPPPLEMQNAAFYGPGGQPVEPLSQAFPPSQGFPSQAFDESPFEKKSSKAPFIVVGLLLVAAGVAFGAWKLFSASSEPSTPVVIPTSSVTSSSSVVTTSTSSSSTASASTSTSTANATLKIRCVPTCDQIEIDSASVDEKTVKSQTAIEAVAGDHHLTLKKNGYEVEHDNISLKPGETFTKDYKLKALPSDSSDTSNQNKTPSQPSSKPCGKFLKRCDDSGL